MQAPLLQNFEFKLRSMRERLLSQIDSDLMSIQDGINPAGNLSNVPVHLGDAAPSQLDAEITLMEMEQDLLALIQHALQRLDDGSFGRCETCGREIPIERLELLPYTPCCVECMRKREKATEQTKGRDATVVRLDGFAAIEYAEREGLMLNKSEDSIDGPASNLSVAEAEAIATDRPDLIWLEVTEDDYQSRRNMTPGTTSDAVTRLGKGPQRSRAGKRSDEVLPGTPTGNTLMDHNAVGTPGGGLAAGGLAGTNASDGAIDGETAMDSAMAAGIYDSNGDDVNVEAVDDSQGGLPVDRRDS